MSGETTATIDYAIDKLNPVFDKLAQMGTQGWEIAVRQQVIEGISAVVIWAVIVAIAAWTIRWAFKRSKQINPAYESFNFKDHRSWERIPDKYLGWADNEMVRAHTLPCIFAGLIFIVSIIFGLVEGSHAVAQIFNPEWAAISALLNLL